jgi:TRAP-type C4-dicarboxylate transport system substrate-binding protein
MKNSKKIKGRGKVAIIVSLTILLSFFCLGTAFAAEKTITLSVASCWAPDWPTNVFMKMWEEKVTKATNGRIKFNNFFGGSLVKMGEEMDAMKSGSVDITCECCCFYPGTMPMGNLGWGNYFIPTDPIMQAKISLKLRKEFPQMVQEVEKNDCKLLFMSAVDTYGLYSTKPIKSIAELKGQKVSGVGRYHPLFFKAIGAELVPYFVGDRYPALQQNVILGDFLPLSFAKPYRFYEVAKYRILIDSGGNHAMPHTISNKAWNKLSASDQKIMLDAGLEMEMESAKWLVADTARSLKELKEKHGVTIMSLPQEEKVKWCEALGDDIWKYARDLEKAGLPGFKFVAAYVRAAEELGFNFVCKQYKNPPEK